MESGASFLRCATITTVLLQQQQPLLSKLVPRQRACQPTLINALHPQRQQPLPSKLVSPVRSIPVDDHRCTVSAADQMIATTGVSKERTNWQPLLAITTALLSMVSVTAPSAVATIATINLAITTALH